MTSFSMTWIRESHTRHIRNADMNRQATQGNCRNRVLKITSDV